MIEAHVDASSLIRSLNQADGFIDVEVHNSLVKSFKEVQQRARAAHRFKSRTGTLVSSIEAEVIEDYGKIFIAEDIAPYGKYVHEGHGYTARKWRPDRFITNAVRYHKKKIQQGLSAAIARALKRAGF